MVSIRSIALGIAFAVLLPLLVHYGILLIKPRPDFKGPAVPMRPSPTATEQEKLEYQQKKNEYEAAKHLARTEYDKAQREWSFFNFYASLIAGIAFLIIGILLKAEFIGAGFIIAGVINIVVGNLFAWFYLAPLTRFLVLLGILVLLSIVSYLFVQKRR